MSSTAASIPAAAAPVATLLSSPETSQELSKTPTGEGDNTTASGKPKDKEKKKLFGLLKKKDGKSSKTGTDTDSPSLESAPTAASSALAAPAAAAAMPSSSTVSPSATTPARPIPRSVSPGPQQPHMTPPSQPTQFPASPQSHISAASPSRYVRSSSPRLHSPASSLIFERNVQEAPLPDDLQAAIPHHIQTEDYIPAILEASSHAITDDKLNPDEVEIVMHSAHQPAASSIAHAADGALSPLSLGGHASDVPTTSALSLSALSSDSGAADEPASHYGALDATDVRRLSFISFADVVQGEHALDGSSSGLLPKDLHMSIMSTTTNRSPSPVRSPASSHGGLGEFGMSPPTSGTSSVKGVDLSSPGNATHSPPAHERGELTVETMRQALRKTGSGDLSAARSPISPVDRSSVLLLSPGVTTTSDAAK